MSPRLLKSIVALLLASGLWAVAPVRAQVTETSVTLAWTAPGDDSLSGTATRYDLRWSPNPITTLTQFSQATPVTGMPNPQPAGSAETVTVSGLTPSTTYSFVIRTFDEAGNGSGLSNVATVTTLTSTDAVRPAPVSLALVSLTNTSVRVSWTDVGDDSLTGNATATELRWSTAVITDANWSSATNVPSVPAPGAPGTAHQLTISGLDRTRDLWFAARARDEVNQLSTVASTLAVPHLLDTAPPATPSGLTATAEPPTGVMVSWAANSEPDLAGYHVYRGLSSGGLFTRLTTSPDVTNQYLDTTAPDTLAVWYSVSAVDVTGNESARSASFRVFLQGTGIPEWNASTPFPNPSHVGAPVTVPLEVPGTGPYDAVVEIQDGAGQHVRTLRVSNASPGPVALIWDGRNDDGRATVPGVYRAWVRAGDRRVLVRFVRIP